MRLSLLTICLLLAALANGQTEGGLPVDKPEKEYVYNTFSSSRVINAQSTETLEKGYLEYRVMHRFGDIASDEGGVQTFFGTDEASDVLIGFEYGITNDLTLGIGRAKGGNPQYLTKLFYGQAKYRILQQTGDNSMPVSLVAYANAVISADGKEENAVNELVSFPKAAHRWTYLGQLIVARKFGDLFSFQLMPTYLHRNLVPFGDENDLFALGAGARIRITKTTALVLEGFYPFSNFRSDTDDDFNYHIPIHIGVEFETVGHVFHVNFTNSSGILENDFIAYNTNDWLDGAFRFGFTIKRDFKITR